MSGDVLLFVALPNLALIAAVVLSLYRTVSRPVDLQTAPEGRGGIGAIWGVTPLQWGLGIILGAHLIAVVLPGTISGWNAAPARLYLLEGSGLALGLWALVGFGVLAGRYLFTEASDRPIHWADAVVVIALGLLIVTGIITAVFYRFGSAWGTAILVPYLRQLPEGTANAGLVADLPVATQVHILSFFALVAAFPLSRFVSLLAVPLAYGRRAWRTVGTIATAPEAAGTASSRLSWGAAYTMAVGFLVVVVVAVVWLPSRLMSAMGSVAEPIPQLVASGVWFVALGGVLVALRWAQKSGRI